MLDEPQIINPANLMVRAFDSNSFVLGSCPSSKVVDRHCYGFLTKTKQLYSGFLVFISELGVGST